MEVIRAWLPDVDGHEYIDVQVSKGGEKCNIMGANVFRFSFNRSTWKCLWLFGKQKSLIIYTRLRLIQKGSFQHPLCKE